ALREDHTRELAQIQGRAGTELDRVFTFRHLGLEKLRHTLEPEVQYLFLPPLHRDFVERTVPCADVPGFTRTHGAATCGVRLFGTAYDFDERDAVNRLNFVSYGLTSRLWGRGATPSEETAQQTEAAVAPSVDPETMPQGLPADAVPTLVGPPA